MKVFQAMTRKVISVSPEDTLKEVGRIIFGKKIDAVPVVDGRGKLVGIVAEGDLLSKFYPSHSEFVEDFVDASKFEEMEEDASGILKMKVKDVMKKDVVCTYPDVPLLRAASKMIVRKIGRLPVVERETTKLVGVISKGDVFKAILKLHILPIHKSFKKIFSGRQGTRVI